MTIYHKIETLFERDKQTFKVLPGRFKSDVFEQIGKWHWTEKLDGMNVRCVYERDSLVFGGRSDNTQFPPALLKRLQEDVTIEKIKDSFSQAESVVLYGEGIGPGIQKVGKRYGDHQRFVMFDILVNNEHWLNPDVVAAIGTVLGLDTAPSLGVMSLETAVALVREGFSTYLTDSGEPAEGLIGRAVGLFDYRGHRLITKLKTKDF
jgi:hypothetical protein